MNSLIGIKENVHARRGIVLLIVLVMLTMASIATTTIASQSLALASQTLIEEKALQDRWAIISINKSLTPRADQMIDNVRETSSGNRRSIKTKFTLSGRTYQIRVDDEDAKVNLKSLLLYGGRESFNARLQQLSAETKLYFDTPIQKNSAIISSWSELLQEKKMNYERIWDGTENLTLYGSGRLNIQFADVESIRILIESAMNKQIANLVISRLSQDKETSVREIGIRLRNQQRERLSKIISDHSSTYSIWIRSLDRQNLLQVQIIKLRNGRKFTESIVW